VIIVLCVLVSYNFRVLVLLRGPKIFYFGNEDGLQVFNEPKWKLEIILQYFWKYTAKVTKLPDFLYSHLNCPQRFMSGVFHYIVLKSF
jgi:hypothetical protein